MSAIAAVVAWFQADVDRPVGIAAALMAAAWLVIEIMEA